MSLGFVIAVAGCAFAAGTSAMIWAQGRAENWVEDRQVGGWLWVIFTLATVGMMAMGWWIR